MKAAGSRGGEGVGVSPQVFHILLSLADRPRHGYGILLEVQDRTEGSLRLGTGTLYSVIKRLLRKGWIEEADSPAGVDEDGRRKHYRLTGVGRRVMTLEAERLQAMVLQARAKSVLPEAT